MQPAPAVSLGVIEIAPLLCPYGIVSAFGLGMGEGIRFFANSVPSPEILSAELAE